MSEILAHLADGTTMHFPEGTSDEAVQRAVFLATAPANQPAYKQKTAQMQADANAPIPTAATGLQNLGESAVDSLKGMVTAPFLHHQQPTAPGLMNRLSGDASEVGNFVSGMGHGVVDPVVDYIKSLQAGQPDAAARAGGQILTQTAPALHGAYEAADVVKGALNSSVTHNITGPAVNSAMEIPKRMQATNIDPGRQLITDKFVGSKPAAAQFMKDQLSELGPQLEQRLTTEGQGRQINGKGIIDSELGNAKRSLLQGSDPAFQTRVDNVGQGIEAYAKQQGIDLERMSPLQAQRLKSYIGDNIKWNDATGPHEAGINDALSGIYGGLKDGVAQTVPGISGDMQKWGNYEVGSKALDASVNADRFRQAVDLRSPGKALNPLNSMPISSTLGRAFRDPLPPVPDPTVIPEARRLNAGNPLPNGGQSMGEPINVTNGRPEAGTRAERTGRLLGAGKVDANGQPLYEMRGQTADQNPASSVTTTQVPTQYETVLDRARRLREADKKPAR